MDGRSPLVGRQIRKEVADRMMKKLFLLMLCLALLVRCGPATPTTPVIDGDFVLIYNSAYYTMYRFIDKEMGVACWVYDGLKEGGISCIPLAQTGG